MALNRNNIIQRAQIIRAIREYFDSQGFVEVETPLRIPANAPEEHIDPCASADMFLHTSPEICMKRLLSQGYEKIYQICRCWRTGERGSRHLPEFTMLEWYRANADYTALMRDCEDLLLHVSTSIGMPGSIEYEQKSVQLDAGFTKITVRNAFINCMLDMEEALRNDRFDELMVTTIEPSLPQAKPVLLLDYPIEMAALARPKPDNPQVAERFELYAGGMELANGFSELNDADEQRKRFENANQKRVEAGLPPLPLPEPFLRDLPSMPPSAGIALGIDRLVMLFTGASRIDDVITFTPEQL